MRGQEAITIICKMLASANMGVHIFKNNREINFSGVEYIVVNHLSFPQEPGLQEGYANINIHVKDAATGEPDSGRINEISESVLPLFKEIEDAEGNVYTKRSGAEFSLYDDSFSDDDDGTHYQNFKIKVVYIN
ncbi:hypothetical protein [Parabacteroides sp.]|jgi:hypothetical protein|uniref:hypothetical protein n=1 Tax=Parabacteroides sp. TaxID=1869337 RepID=UPI001DDBD6CE|nr:hypothetical protein [Parabacteroides sp.]MBS5485471.1 hypothetical protein [Parabacteroides sp.]